MGHESLGHYRDLFTDGFSELGKKENWENSWNVAKTALPEGVETFTVYQIGQENYNALTDNQFNQNDFEAVAILFINFELSRGGGRVGKRVGKSILSKGINELPNNVQSSFNQYNKSGWKGNIAGQTKGTKAGGGYENSNGALPTKDSAGNAITYREFDVNNKVPGQTRDAERFVVGSDGSIYFTNSHYGDIKSPTEFPDFVKLK